MGECVEFDQLQESSKCEEISRKPTNGLVQWKRTKTICNAYIGRGDLTEVNKVWFYIFNSVLTPLKHVSNYETRPCLVCTS